MFISSASSSFLCSWNVLWRPMAIWRRPISLRQKTHKKAGQFTCTPFIPGLDGLQPYKNNSSRDSDGLQPYKNSRHIVTAGTVGVCLCPGVEVRQSHQLSDDYVFLYL